MTLKSPPPPYGHTLATQTVIFLSFLLTPDLLIFVLVTFVRKHLFQSKIYKFEKNIIGVWSGVELNNQQELLDLLQHLHNIT